MKKLLVVFLALGFLTGCMGGKNAKMYGTCDGDKKASLKFTKVGLTSSYEFAGLASGTYKSVGFQGGLGYQKGTQCIDLTVNAAQKWAVSAKARRQGYRASGLGVQLDNPYVATVTRGGKRIGTIGVSMPKVDTTKNILKNVGLDTVINRNLRLTGQATILGKTYKIRSEYMNIKGEKQSTPVGYKIMKGKKTLGRIRVDKNMFGGQVLTLWVTPGLKPVTQQSVVASLLVCGWAI